jgi:hypothetical protein
LGKPCHTSRMGGNNAHPAPAVGVPAPAALGPTPRPPACGWEVAQVRRTVHSGARVGWHNALRVACAGGPFRRPPPAVRRRDRPRADGDARRAEGARAHERRRAATSSGCRRAACTPAAQLRRRYFLVPVP